MMGFARGCGDLLCDDFLRRFSRWPIRYVSVVGIFLNRGRKYPQPMLLKIAGPYIRAATKGLCGLPCNVMADAPDFFLGKLKVASHR